MVDMMNKFGIAASQGYKAFKAGAAREVPDDVDDEASVAWLEGYDGAAKLAQKKESKSLDDALANFYEAQE